MSVDYNFLYRNGFIGCWYLRQSQIPLYQLILKKRKVVCSCRRRFGKTTAIVIALIEKCLAQTGLRVYYGSPQLNQSRAILSQVLDHVYSYAPLLKPKYNTQDGCYIFDNGSRIILFGAKDTSELDKCRGQEADILVLDEYAHFKYRPEYILKEVLMPMLFTTHGKLIISSTPSKDLTHPYFNEIREAQRNNEFFTHTIEDSVKCGDITEEEKEQIIRDCGGIDSESYQREWLCRVVPPISSLIIPEASDGSCFIEDSEYQEYKKLLNYKYYHKYMSMDIGVKDYTCILFFTYIFDKDIVLIEDEVVLKNEEVTTRNIASKIKEKIDVLWKGSKVYHAVSDNNNLILLRDLMNMEGINFSPIRKDSLLAMVNLARLIFVNKRIKITPSCQYLRDCLLYGLWNEKRDGFLRSDSLGHLDALASLIYGVRVIDKISNPIPFVEDKDTFYPQKKTLNNNVNTFKKALKI